MRTAEIESFCRRVKEAKPAATQLTVPAAEAYAVAQAVAIKLMPPMSEERFWQELVKAKSAAIEGYRTDPWVMAKEAGKLVEEYRTRYGEKPQAVASAMPECPKVAEPVASQPEPDPEHSFSTNYEFSAAVRQAVSEANPPHEMLVEPDPEPTAAVEPQPNKTLEELTGTSDKIEWMKYADRGPYPEPTAEDSTPAVAPQEPCIVRGRMLPVDPEEELQHEPDEEVLDPDTIAVSPYERKGLEWKQTAWKSEWVAIGAGHSHRVYMREDGQFVASYGTRSMPFPSLAEAQAWCEDQETKMFAQQAAEQEGKSDEV